MSGLRHNSYYDKKLAQSPALVRARRPYLFKNIFTGLALIGVTASIYTYTLMAVGQDDFEDVKVPDVPVQPAQPAKK
ncbi:hypothetical protein QBC40DRAFT_271220 [Triangularia verruculosa]|uniref:Cytochrome c oxidase assembly factor 3 n=1 Tax=Triangularia verruculosa TaxID=2587418 RepID=A0AAN7AZY4_9PEZI|nr:hypothetical protein QBC40DRAFT_271220 [Triangularia verruculosa]